MRKILLIMFMVPLLSGCINSEKYNHVHRIKDYSDVPLTKYTLQEWENLGINVWENYYSSTRWEEITSNISRVNGYELSWKRRLNFVLNSHEEKEGISVDKEKVEFLAKPLYEEIVPKHNWTWFDSKERMLFCEYTIVYDGLKLKSYTLTLPPTE